MEPSRPAESASRRLPVGAGAVVLVVLGAVVLVVVGAGVVVVPLLVLPASWL